MLCWPISRLDGAVSHADLRALAAAALVAVVTAAGGFGDPRWTMAVGGVTALLLLSLLGRAEAPATSDQRLALAVLGVGLVAAVVRAEAVAEARTRRAGWLIAWVLWRVTALASAAVRPALRLVMASAAVAVAAAVLADGLAAVGERTGGLLLNPNDSAALMIPTLGLAWVVARGRGPRVAVGVLAALVVAAAVATGSRAALLALVAMAAVIVPRGRLRAVLVAMVAVAAASLITWRLVAHPDSMAWQRLSIWAALADIIRDRPLLGWGPGGLADVTGVVRLTHSDRLAHHFHRIGSGESSVIGLMVRVGALGLGLAAAASVAWWRRVAGRGGEVVARARLATMAAMAVFLAVHDLTESPLVLWWWAILLGLLEPAPALDPRLWRRRWPAPAVVAAAAVVAWAVVHPAWVEQRWRSGSPTAAAVIAARRADRVALDPVTWQVGRLLAAPRWSWEEAAEALFWSRWAVTVDGGKAALWSDYGRVQVRLLHDLGSWPDALAGARAAFARATALEPRLPWAWLEWAQLERMAGDLEAARRCAQRSVDAEPSFARGWLLLARLELDRGRPEEAKRCLAQALAARRHRFTAQTGYERELVAAPPWQVAELDRLLR